MSTFPSRLHVAEDFVPGTVVREVTSFLGDTVDRKSIGSDREVAPSEEGHLHVMALSNCVDRSRRDSILLAFPGI